MPSADCCLRSWPEGQLAPSETLFRASGDTEFVEKLCASLFSPAVRTFYFHMLPHRQVLARHASAGVPWGDALFVRLGYPLWRRLLQRGLNLDGFDAEEQAMAIDKAFSSVEHELGPGLFLGGEEPGIRDIVFAVLASPVILPPGHPASIPSPGELPEAFRSRLEQWRARPAGQLALRVYEQRPAPLEWGEAQSDRQTIIQEAVACSVSEACPTCSRVRTARAEVQKERVRVAPRRRCRCSCPRLRIPDRTDQPGGASME